ncbi:hypothetical protein GGD46_005134 [Rhizobium lusitanum]|uniref:Uncharacterized protein n=1 Tax=Rhizobium lusitanum TaxID=293958 RepID=A0A7X0MEL8_9HYPH|nr:hypothetical protein [Rhizobium lusitanum]MBB6487824.1 hypothetical protein [Rhizobium lusitanum]
MLSIFLRSEVKRDLVKSIQPHVLSGSYSQMIAWSARSATIRTVGKGGVSVELKELHGDLSECADEASTRNRLAVHLAQEVREAGATVQLDGRVERNELKMIAMKAMAHPHAWPGISARAKCVAPQLVVGRTAEFASLKSCPSRSSSVSQEMRKGSRQENVRVLDDEDKLCAFRWHVAPIQSRRNILAKSTAGKLTWDCRASAKSALESLDVSG